MIFLALGVSAIAQVTVQILTQVAEDRTILRFLATGVLAGLTSDVRACLAQLRVLLMTHGMSGKITPSRSTLPAPSGSKMSEVAYIGSALA